MNSDNYLDANLDEGGAGFLFLLGKVSGWLFTFDEANDTTTAHVLPCTTATVANQLAVMLEN